MKILAIFCEQRTGSNYLLGCLSKHPGFANLNEFLNRDSAPALPTDIPLTITDDEFNELRRTDPVKLLETYAFRPGQWADGIEVIGLKFQYHNITSKKGKALLAYLNSKANQVYCIHLIRRNPFERLISKINAEKAGCYIRLAGESTTPPPDPYSISPHLFETKVNRYLNDIGRTNDKLHRFENRMDVIYEDLVHEPDQHLPSIQQFLGLAPMHLPPATEKQRIEPRFQIKNYYYLKARYEGSEYQKFFRDGPGY